MKLRLDNILALLEKTFPKLKGLLPPIYAGSNLDKENIAGLINLFSKDIFRFEAGGTAGFVMATGELSNSEVARLAVRRALIEGGLVDCVGVTCRAPPVSQMLPVLTSILMGGLFHSMQNQGLGGALGQLAGAVLRGGQGMGGAMPGNMPGQQAGAQGGMGGLGDILGKMFGGGGMGQAAGGGGLGGIPPQNSLQPGLQGQAKQLGLDTLSKMFQHGTQVAQAQQAGLQDIFSQMLGAKR